MTMRTSHRTFIFGLFSIKNLKLISPWKHISQATHHKFMTASQKTFTEIKEILPFTKSFYNNRAMFDETSCLWKPRDQITWIAQLRIQWTNNFQKRPTLQFQAYKTSLFLMHSQTWASFVLSCLYTVSKMRVLLLLWSSNQLTWPRQYTVTCKLTSGFRVTCQM